MASPFLLTVMNQKLWEQARSHSLIFARLYIGENPASGLAFRYSFTEKETAVRNVQRVIHLLLLAGLALPPAPALADAKTPAWKDTGPVTKKKQQEVNSGSWQPQPQPSDVKDPENPINEGEDSATFDDGET